jgi:hypothetical protein
MCRISLSPNKKIICFLKEEKKSMLKSMVFFVLHKSGNRFLMNDVFF